MKKILSFLVVLLCALSQQMWAQTTTSQPAVGDGSAANPYQITSPDELRWFALHVGESTANAAACAKLMNDITMSTMTIDPATGTTTNQAVANMKPIGSYPTATGSTSYSFRSYTGTFDGQGYVISGAYASAYSNYYSRPGFVSVIGASGVVKNVVLKNCYGYTPGNGCFCNTNSGTIENCRYEGYCKKSDAGATSPGFCGTNNGKIYSCSVDIYMECAAGADGVGFCAYNYGEIKDCLCKATVNNKTGYTGFCVKNSGVITNSTALTTINSTSSSTTNYAFVQTNNTSTNSGNYAMFTPAANGTTSGNTTGITTVSSIAAIQNHYFDAQGICTLHDNDYQPATQASDCYYEIKNAGNLKWFAQTVNAGSKNINARLINDIDLSSICSATAGNWTPIGNSYTICYSGTFDGNGKAISNLYIANATTELQGLFGFINNSVIKNLSVSGNITSTANYVGLLVGNNGGQIIHCISSGSASGYSDVGGIAGTSNGSVTQCVNKAELSSTSGIIGGITANCNGSSVTDCLNEGTVKAGNNGYKNTAGIVGSAIDGGTIKNCLNMGKVYVAGALTEDYPILGSDQNTSNPATLTNNYYLNTLNSTAVKYGTAKTADELKTGIVARLLNGGNGTTESATSVWGQTLATTGGDAYPVMMTDGNANAVYCASVNEVKTYWNTGKVITIPAATTSFVDEKIYTGDYKDASGTVVSGSSTVQTADITLSQSVDNMASHKSNADSYYEISTPVQMKWFEYYVNATTSHAATNARLMADIDLSSICGANVGTGGTNWMPIANIAAGYQDRTPKKLYTGTFDGNNKTISGLYIHGDNSYYNALFRYNEGTIKNLTVDVDIDARDFDAAIAYDNFGTISHCTSKGKIQGVTQVGGLVAINNGIIEYCTNEVAIISTLSARLGGIAELNIKEVKYCINKGTVSSTEGSMAGGIVANNGGTVSNCANLATVSSKGYAGGIIGNANGTINNCYNIADVTSLGGIQDGEHYYPSYAGAIIGYVDGSITTTNCHYLSTLTLKRSDKDTTLVGVGTGGTYETNTYAHTSDVFKSGTVARLLNGGDGTTEKPLSVWGQNLATTGGDAHPVMMTDGNTNAVYCVTAGTMKLYGNTGNVITIPAATTSFVDEKIYSGDYKDAAGKVVSGSYTVAAADIALSQPVDDMANHKNATDSYYQISTPEQMKWLSYYVNATTDHAATNARLMNDIDLSSVCSNTAGNWTPIGNYYNTFYGGTFDGNGKAITNLYIANPKTYFQGLFGCTKNSVIKNLSVSGNITSTAAHVGLLVGRNIGQIIHCISAGSASGNSNVGGIAGTCGGSSITQCVNKAELSSTSANIGGITGGSGSSNVTDCFTEGTVKSSNSTTTNTAGIVGYISESNFGTDDSNIKNCLNMGQVYVADVLTKDYPILGKYITSSHISTLTNNYYLNNGITATYGTAKTADELKNGIVARLLNGGDGTTEKPLGAWGQNLATTGGDAHPVFMTDGNTNAVYCVTAGTTKLYGNTGNVITLPATFDGETINGYKDASGNTILSSYTVQTADITLSQAADNMANHKSTADSYYEISTPIKMKWFEYYVNATTDHAATNARLMADIDLSSICGANVGTGGTNWTPIANKAAGYGDVISKSYIGTFDGNGKTISGLYINDASACNPLFCYVGATVKNLTVDADIKGYSNCAAIAAYNLGAISGCTAKGTITSTGASGGVASYNEGTIEHCANEAKVTSSLYDKIGGITGENPGTINYRVNRGIIENTGTYGMNSGGIAGTNNSTISNSYNLADVTGKGYVGGIIGSLVSGSVTNCYNTANVTSTGSSTTYFGGTIASTPGSIAGYAESSNNPTLTNCHYLSTITLNKDNNATTLVGVGIGGTYETSTYAHTSDVFKSGIVARLLNGGDGTTENPLSAWGQNLATIGGDAYPVMMTDGNTNAVYAAKTYNGSSTATAEGYMNLSYAAPSDNTMTVVKDAGINKNLLPANVITAENTARRIVITDGKDVYIPANVTADSASYSRSAFRDGYHETICIPFAPAALPADYNFSAFNSKDNANTTAYFSTVTALNAGQAYMMKYTATAADTKADVTFENNGGNVTVLAAPVSSNFMGR